jgi:hypothetical protein
VRSDLKDGAITVKLESVTGRLKRLEDGVEVVKGDQRTRVSALKSFKEFLIGYVHDSATILHERVQEAA